MPQTEQFDSHGQTSGDFIQTPKNVYQIQLDSKYVYADPALNDFSDFPLPLIPCELGLC